MKKHIIKIAFLLIFALCLPTLASCDLQQFFNPSDASQSESTNATDTQELPTESENLPDGLEFTLNPEGTYTVSRYGGNDAVITIPETYDGKEVTVIGSNAFAGCKALQSITIPNSVTAIGDNAFKNCSMLEIISIGTSKSELTSIGKYAFSNCDMLKEIVFIGSESNWNAIEKGTSWDKNAGSKTDAQTFDVIFIANIETDTESSGTEIVETQTSPTSSETTSTDTESSNDCSHEDCKYVSAIAATCTDGGRKAYMICNLCGTYISLDGVILNGVPVVPAKGHSYNEFFENPPLVQKSATKPIAFVMIAELFGTKKARSLTRSRL